MKNGKGDINAGGGGLGDFVGEKGGNGTLKNDDVALGGISGGGGGVAKLAKKSSDIFTCMEKICRNISGVVEVYHFFCTSSKMNTNNQIFTGIFADELGQRFLKIACSATDNAFKDVCESHGSSNRLKECLLKVPHWNTDIIEEEHGKLNSEYLDFFTTFKQVYVNYVKLMRGSNQVKIMVNLPRMEDFLKSFFVNVSCNKFMKDGKYFERGPLDQRAICMECLRDSLYEYLGEENVKIEVKKKKSFKAPPSIAEDESYYSDEIDSIVPDDSISSIGYHERKRNPRQYEDDKVSTESLSSVSLSQVSRKDKSVVQDSRSEVSLDNSEDKWKDVSKKDKIDADPDHTRYTNDRTKRNGSTDDRSYISETEGLVTQKTDEKSRKGFSEDDRSSVSNTDHRSSRKMEDDRSYISANNTLSKRSEDRLRKAKDDEHSEILSRTTQDERRKTASKENESVISYDEIEHKSQARSYATSRDDERSQISSNDRARDRQSKQRYKHRNDEDDQSVAESSHRRRHRMSRDDESDISVHKTRRKKNSNKYSDSSEEDEPNNNIKSPCKSYVTRLTEDSKMTCEN